MDELDNVIKKAVDFYKKQTADMHRDRKSVISALLNNPVEERPEDAEKYQLTQKFYQVFLLELDEFCLIMNGSSEEIKYNRIKRYKELVGKCQTDGMITLEHSEYGTVICIVENDEAGVNIKAGKLMKWVREFNGSEPVNAKVTLAGSEAGCRYSQLNILKNQAKEALRFKFIKGIGSTILYGDIREFIHSGQENIEQIQIPLPMKIKEREDIGSVIASIKGGLEGNTKNIEFRTRMILGNWFLHISEALAEYNIDINDIFEKPTAVFEKMTGDLDFQGIMIYFEEVYTSIFDYVQAKKQGKYIDVIAMAARYMKDNYKKMDLSIEEVAEHVNMSVGYFSMIFHNETGCTFTDYLVRIRMTKAMELLENTNRKLTDISGMTGYGNSNYFSTVFKKYTGMTPSAYRKNNSRNDCRQEGEIK